MSPNRLVPDRLVPGRLAIVRPPADSFVNAVSSHPERDRIDPERARAQHAVYCRLLEAAGMQVVALPPDKAHPDACFTQDAAVVLWPATGGDPAALLCRFGTAARLGEQTAVAPVLEAVVASLGHVGEPATLEGGDVLAAGRVLAVGRSRRTNEAGIAALRLFAEPLGYRVVPVTIPAWALHLSTAATVVGERLVLGAPEVVEQEAFAGIDAVAVPDDQRLACNVWSGGPGGRFVIAAGRHPVHRELEARGFEVHPTDLSEFNRADGSPTCLSLVAEPRTPAQPGIGPGA